MHASHLCLPHAPTCIHSAGVLFSTDRYCVCHQLVNSLQLNTGCVFAVSCVAVAKWDALQ